MPDEDITSGFSEPQGRKTGGDAPWYADYDEINSDAELRAVADKYKDGPAAVVKAHRDLQKKLGGSFRLPDDLKGLSAEQRADLMAKAASLRDLPETADGYEISVPEGLSRNENLEAAFKAWAFERKMDKNDVAGLMDFYHNVLLQAKQAQQQDDQRNAHGAETQFRISKGPDFDRCMENIKRMRVKIADDCNFGYTNEAGELASRFDDLLDRPDTTGRKMGNDPLMLQFLSHLWDKWYASSAPVESSGAAGRKTKTAGYPDYAEMG